MEDDMQLYLVQHGAAKAEAEDPARPLSDDGRRTVQQMADYLSGLGPCIDLVEHSTKLRARQTAEILASLLHPSEGIREVVGISPNDDIAPMREHLHTETRNLMLVGHLPYLARLVSQLLGVEKDRTVVDFQMGGVVRLDRNVGGEWTLRWMIVPGMLPGLIAKRRTAA
jgi:phosphohistidine phosphatase